MCVVAIALLLVSCGREDRLYCYDIPDRSGTKASYKNPYSLSIMQAALDSLQGRFSTKTEGSILRATDYYVRLQPRDSLTIFALQSNNIELFDYPLDVDFENEGEFWFNPQTPDDTTHWQYTAIPVEYATDNDGNTIGINLPLNPEREIICELLDSCYIPDHDHRTKSCVRFSVSELEKMAYKLAGVPETKSNPVSPCGTVKYSAGGRIHVVDGVKVRAQRFVRWSTTTTNETGVFYIQSTFSTPNISIIYSNTKGFTLWGNWAFIAPATHTSTKCSDAGHFDKTFYQSSGAPWTWAVINGATVDYYNACVRPTGILKDVPTPPDDLKIWCMNTSFLNVGGGAPMFRHLSIARFFFFGPFAWFIEALSPDVIMMTENKGYNDLYATIFHELSHASHFVSTGEIWYWPIIEYEGVYGFADDYGPGGDWHVGRTYV